MEVFVYGILVSCIFMTHKHENLLTILVSCIKLILVNKD